MRLPGMFLTPGPTCRYYCLHILKKVCLPNGKSDAMESFNYSYYNLTNSPWLSN